MIHERLDEMVDGKGGFRPGWNRVMSAFRALGDDGVAQRIGRLSAAFDEEGVSSLLPGSVQEHAWRCDPVPLLIGAAEFEVLQRGLCQRARLMEAVLGDVYGRQDLLAEGLLPPALVQANPAFLRACCMDPATSNDPRFPLLHQYAVDLLRGPDGAWRVLADRTAAASGIAYARENRRILGRVVPEAFRQVQVQPLRSFFETWQDSLQRLVPHDRSHPRHRHPDPGIGPSWLVRAHVPVARAVLRAGGRRRPDGAGRLRVPEDPARPAAG